MFSGRLAWLFLLMCLAQAEECPTQLRVYLTAFGIQTEGSTFIYHKVTHVDGPSAAGITVGNTSGCGSTTTNCAGSFTIADVSQISEVAIYWNAGKSGSDDRAYFFKSGSSNVRFNFDASADSSCTDGASDGEELKVFSTCNQQPLPQNLDLDDSSLKLGCEISASVRYTAQTDDSEVPELVFEAEFPSLDSAFDGRSLTYTWGDQWIRQSGDDAAELKQASQSWETSGCTADERYCFEEGSATGSPNNGKGVGTTVGTSGDSGTPARPVSKVLLLLSSWVSCFWIAGRAWSPGHTV